MCACGKYAKPGVLSRPKDLESQTLCGIHLEILQITLKVFSFLLHNNHYRFHSKKTT